MPDNGSLLKQGFVTLKKVLFTYMMTTIRQLDHVGLCHKFIAAVAQFDDESNAGQVVIAPEVIPYDYSVLFADIERPDFKRSL